MRNMLRTDRNLWGETQERKMTDQIKRNKNLKEDEERLKEWEKKIKSRKYLHFIFNLFYHFTVLRSRF